MISLTSNASKASKTLVACPISAPKIGVKLIHVLRTSNSSQCPYDWFITHAMTTRFKTNANASIIAHTSTLRTLYYKPIFFVAHNTKE
jgi:hypothetical protein